MSNRVPGMVKKLTEAGFTHALIHKRQNMFYLTGYTGEGCLFVGPEGAVILTDFRYTEQAERQAPGCRIIRTGAGVRPYEECAKMLAAAGAKTLAIETDFVTVDEEKAIAEAMEGVTLKPLGHVIDEMRILKDADEIAAIEEACRISCKAFEHMLGVIHAGMTEKQVQVELDYTMLRLGADGLSFDTIACAGVNGSLPHAIPSDHVIEKGELLTMDFGALYHGYHADMTRTIAIGEVSAQLEEIYYTVLEAQKKALDMLHEGVVLSDVDKCARDFLEAKYPGAFGHSLGHGVGLDIHEQPGLSMRDHRTLAVGHVVTVEPGVYLPGVGGCRIEDMGVLTENGFKNMIFAPKELIRV